MEEINLNNDFLVDNFQEEAKNSQTLKSDSINDPIGYNEINDNLFQNSINTKDNGQKDFSKNLSIQQNPSYKNFNNKNNYNNNYNLIYNNENDYLDFPENSKNYNLNEDISGISLLKELEDQWNNIEKKKMNYNKNKGDESTYSNSKTNNNYEKYKYIKEMVELKKNKFLSERQKAKNIRDNDQEIEQFFLTKFKDMEKYKIIDNNLKNKIEIRQQEKMNENKNNQFNDNEINNMNKYEFNNYESNQNIKNEYNYNYNNNNYDNNYMNYNKDKYEYNYYENNNKFNSQFQERKGNNYSNISFLQNEEINNNKINNFENKKLFLENNNPELDDLVYETPARSNIINNNQIIEQIKENNFNNMNSNIYNEEFQKNNNINKLERIYKSEKNLISGKLMKKMKNLFEEISQQNNQNNIIKPITNNNINSRKHINSYESGVFGINNININNNTDNEILKNIKNNKINNKEINDANKSINLNFNYNDNYNINNIKNNYQNSSFIQSNNINIPIYNNNQEQYDCKKDNNDISINKDKSTFIQENNNDELSCLQQNFDDIMNQIKSGINNIKSNRNNKKINLFENDNKLYTEVINNENPELDKYFEELSKEAKLKINKNKTIDNPIIKNNYQENKIKNKIKENSEMLTKFVNEMNQNKNKFKQRMIALNNNLNNIKIYGGINDINRNKKYGESNANIHQRSLSGYKISPFYSKKEF